MLGGLGQMMRGIARFLWGDFESREELQKFIILGIIFGLDYWCLLDHSSDERR